MKKIALVLSLERMCHGLGLCRRPGHDRLVEGSGNQRAAVLSRPVLLRVAAQQRPQGRNRGQEQRRLRRLPYRARKRRSARRSSRAGPSSRCRSRARTATSDLKFQAAYDAKNAYLRFEWKTLNAFPGTEHQYLRYDGKEWKVYGYPEARQGGAGRRPARHLRGPHVHHPRRRQGPRASPRKAPGLPATTASATMPKQFTKEEIAGERAHDRSVQEERCAQVPPFAMAANDSVRTGRP